MPDLAGAWTAWLTGLLVYPGLGFALALALGIELVRSLGTALLAPPGAARAIGWALVTPLRAFRHGLAARRPERGTESAWGPGGQVGLALAGLLAPVAALALMPLPGHPLAAGAGHPAHRRWPGGVGAIAGRAAGLRSIGPGRERQRRAARRGTAPPESGAGQRARHIGPGRPGDAGP